jgi:hypothetical protein
LVESSFSYSTPNPESVAVVRRSARGEILAYVTPLEAEQIREFFGTDAELVMDEAGALTLLLDDEDTRAFGYLSLQDLPGLLEDRP